MGGMETHLLAFANHLHGENHDVGFLVTTAVGDWHDRPAEAGIPVSTVLQGRWESKIEHAQRVLSELHGYDAVMLNHCPPARAVVGSVDLATAVVSMIHTDHPDDYPLALSGHGDIDRTICPSSQIYRTALEKGASEESLFLVPYGVRVASDRPPETPDTPKRGGPHIAFVGRLAHEHKGVLNLPAIVARFAARYDGACQLDVVGDGPDLEALRREIARLGVGEMVNLVGHLSHDEVLARLPRYDLLLMPSRYEGLPLVILEAMAAGVVPVVTDLPGVADELIRDQVNGLLVPRDDVDAFADALERGARPSVHASLSRAAWQTIRDRFSSERMLDRHAEVLVEAVEKRRNGTLPRSGIASYDLLGRGARAPRVFIDAVKRGRKIRRSYARVRAAR
jgi:glycosyltransferase involved in cell wall biosynthesis